MKKDKLKPIIILGIYLLIATPVIWFGVSYINSHSIQLPSLEGFDFKTPALYFFSAVAQTMGAL
ncbi:MAG: hypothetical protein KAH30_01235, partial [Caldisericia bacterium]|nr:hypothetical protein [Caldisericia bacterium]